MESLRALQREPIELLAPGHGPWVEDPAAKLAEYVEHRESRERRLLAALGRGERSRQALLDEVWDDVPAELRPYAVHVMEAHLQKLSSEGRLPGDLTA
jgi:glyoxylase-like metal-dependent hydrolase (beta-lactamase superfamily II)